MENRRWLDPSQPQTLQGAVMLSYINAVFGIIGLISGAPLALIGLLQGVGAFGIANEKRWGFRLDIGAAILNLALFVLVLFVGISIWTILSLAFAVILVALLLHPQSREYQRIWFH
ncbi:MAG TPA: hypothetical protein VEJ87_12845 [Acidimicrobiales bacterium]|nr:hypothetical protein [Acidimicrobiales bacterium]